MTKITASAPPPAIMLEILVRNHPGVMSHVCGLFARRAFNVESILCLPLEHSKQSKIWLLVNHDQRLNQMISQLEKLEDVKQVKCSADLKLFEQLRPFIA